MKKTENIIGFISILLLLILGGIFLKTEILFFKLLVGLGLGYTLARAYTGFAGSVNRAYRTGSTKLMRTMLFMFFITALLTTAFLINSEVTNYNLFIKPINLGLILGGMFFGFGMSISVCCATGVLTDLSQGFPRAFITLIFFGVGVFLGFPVQNTASWIRNSWFITPTGVKLNEGVFLPDYFQWDGFGGYLGALILLALLCGIVSILSYYYEKHLRKKNKFVGLEIEKKQEERKSLDLKKFRLFSAETYNYIFARPWTLKEGAVVMAIIFTLMMGVTGYGWGASESHGIWFGKVLMLFGVSAEAIADFTRLSAESFELPIFQHFMSVQNIGIIVGAVIYLLTAGKFKDFFTSGWHLTKKEVFLYALGGITMGLGTRFANGCNVGALYTPIANFSLSGWFFLAAMIAGGIISNKIFFKPSTGSDLSDNQEEQISV
ncbi:MAG: YeeE/YedE family protein [Halothermotrichaceae bacterium]